MRGALYGLKQSSKVWGEMFTAFMLSIGFKQCVMDTCIYTRGKGRSRIIVGIHVDDQVIVGPDPMVIKSFKQELSGKFKMKDLGALTHILGVEVKRDGPRGVLTLHQGGFMRQILECFGMANCNPTKLPLPPGLTFHQEDEPLIPPTPEQITEFRGEIVRNL